MVSEPINGKSPIDIASPGSVLEQAKANLDLAKKLNTKVNEIGNIQHRASTCAAVGLLMLEVSNQVCYEFMKTLAATRLVSVVMREMKGIGRDLSPVEDSINSVKDQLSDFSDIFDIVAKTIPFYKALDVPTYALDTIVSLEPAFLNAVVSNTLDGA